MSVNYQAVLWNRQKRIYDGIMLGLIGLYLLTFVVGNLALFPEITLETLIIRAAGSSAFIMLHVILSIGPLSRIDKRFLPLLYNRRHLGVTMFLMALIHGVFSLIQFHALGNTNPLLSLFISNTNYGSFINFPFQVLGFLALLILFLMAATSHDFWLKNLSPRIWKSLHMMVYLAYALILMHIMLGVVQLERSGLLVFFVGLGMVWLVTLHLTAAGKEKTNRKNGSLEKNGFYKVCQLDDIADNRAKIFQLNGQDIAVFKYDGKISAVHNACKHQNGPLGEGKIIDGCITCPWHGFQYLPESGASPPPFKEKVHTYDVRIQDTAVYVNPTPYPEGTTRQPALINT